MPRLKRRYLHLKVQSEEPVSRKEITDAIWGTISRLYGEYGASQVNLAIIEYDEHVRYAIVRCKHTALKMVKASTAMITEINGKPAEVQVVKVSGTLKALRRKAVT
ncbi:MAG: hypothetical protein JSV58_06520 [Candidatus Bathyarchaeota archaeon]|nr:MAG: hypothetical protein JSV58_06520 [Candidatus Bathyarchaeota archaeon]